MRIAFRGLWRESRHRGLFSALLIALPSLIASISATVQSNSQSLPSQSLVSKMVENELESQKHPRYWMYLDSKRKPGRSELSRVLQMSDCWLTWPVSIDGRPPTQEELKHAREKMEKLVNNDDARKRNRKEIDSDGQKSAELLKLLPRAFLFTTAGREGRSVRLKFRPNPNYRPSSNEAKVFHSMEGVLLVDAKQARLVKLSGKLISDVDFGFGILGKLQKGGTFEVVQSQVAPNDWEVSLLDVHISGRALSFHSIGEQQHEVRTQFKPVPPGLNPAQAASMLTERMLTESSKRSPGP